MLFKGKLIDKNIIICFCKSKTLLINFIPANCDYQYHKLNNDYCDNKLPILCKVNLSNNLARKLIHIHVCILEENEKVKIRPHPFVGKGGNCPLSLSLIPLPLRYA